MTSLVLLCLALSPLLAAASPTVLDRHDDIQDTYDYIVVGAGTAGLTVADRLSESGRCELSNA